MNGKTPLYKRDPEHVDPRTGKQTYGRAMRFKIWRARLVYELFNNQKPTTSKNVLLDSAVIMLMEIRKVEAKYRDCTGALPAAYWTRLSKLTAVLNQLRPKTQAKTGPRSGGAEQMDLASIIGGKE